MSFPGSILPLLTRRDVTKPEDEKLLSAHNSKLMAVQTEQPNPAGAAQIDTPQLHQNPGQGLEVWRV